MIHDFRCLECDYEFEAKLLRDREVACIKCGKPTKRLFHATSNVYIPPYFHTMKSDIFSYKEWNNLKKNPNIERLR